MSSWPNDQLDADPDDSFDDDDGFDDDDDDDDDDDGEAAVELRVDTVDDPVRASAPRRDHGRGADALQQQRDVPRARRTRGAVAPGDLQAAARRAPTVGLRTRPPPPRGRRVPAERGARHRRDPADGAARRPARRGIGAVVRHGRPSSALLHDLRGVPRAARPSPGDGAARHPRQQHRPQERSLPARRGDRRRRRPRCGASTRACASRRSTSCAP